MIQVFIPTWDSPNCDPERTRSMFAPYAGTTILLSHHRPFAEQWQEAVDRFQGDVFVYAMSDVVPPTNVRQMLNSAEHLMRHEGVAMYAPYIDGSGFRYDVQKLQPIGHYSKVYEVPATALLLCVIRADLLSLAPSIKGNPRGWFYDYVLAAKANELGAKAVIDYRYEAFHPYGSDYDIIEAMNTSCAWLSALPSKLRAKTDEFVAEAKRLMK